jgi:multicomponent Na+:H+ antiporter subunit G
MEIIQTLLVVFLLLGGVFFFSVGTLGLLRLPDVFTRLHATTKSDTLGTGLILLAAMVYLGIDIVVVKVFLILMFIWITNPTAAHIISKAVFDKEILEKKERSEDA